MRAQARKGGGDWLVTCERLTEAQELARIVHLTSAHPAFDIRIFHKECRSLAAAGYDTVLVAPHKESTTTGNVEIAAVPRATGRLRRMTLTASAVFRRALSVRADLYQLHDPELLPWGLLLRVLAKVPVVYDAHEYVGMDVADKEWIPAILARRLGATSDWVEKRIAGRLSGVVVVNQHMAGAFQPFNPRVAVVSNFPHRDLASRTPSESPEPNSVIYVGGIGNIRGYETVLKAMRIVRSAQPAARCRIVGELDKQGVPREYLNTSSDVLRELGIEFLPTAEYDTIPGLIARHSVGWLPWKRCQANLYGLPTKLFEYMALGRPIVASDLPFVAQILERHGCGVVVPSDAPEAHARALLDLFGNPHKSAELGERGRQAVLTSLNWQTQVDALISLYRALGVPPPNAKLSEEAGS